MTDGWFERNMFSELAVLLPIVAMIVFGTLYATTYPVLATISKPKSPGPSPARRP